MSQTPSSLLTPKPLVETQIRADALFSSIGVGAIATDEQGRIYRVNDVALDILDCKKEDLLGEWFPTAIHAIDEDGEEVVPADRPIIQSFLSGKPVARKMRYAAKSGKKVPVSVTVSPILHNKKPIGAVEVFYDCTLEDEVDRMKSEFISIASHRLRTPISAINTYANMLPSGYEGELNQRQLGHMKIILNAVDRMNDLITTLLDISQLESGSLEVHPKEIDITDLLDKIIEEMNQFAVSKNIELRVDYPKEGIVAQCDPLLLGEVFTNLTSNAIKYTPDNGKIHIQIAVKKKEVIFSIQDTGYGIPEPLLKQIFTKFFRASNVQKKNTSGTGLGLYMVKQIADVMNGRLWFDSREDAGSTFYFALPLIPAEA